MKRFFRTLCLLLCLCLTATAAGAVFTVEGGSAELVQLRSLGLIPDAARPDAAFTRLDLSRLVFRLKNGGSRDIPEIYGAVADGSGFADIASLGGEYRLFGGYAVANRLFSAQSATVYGISSAVTLSELAEICLRLIGCGENYIGSDNTTYILQLASGYNILSSPDYSAASSPLTFAQAAPLLANALSARPVRVTVTQSAMTAVRKSGTLLSDSFGEVTQTRQLLVSAVPGGYMTASGLFAPSDTTDASALGFYADLSLSGDRVCLALSGDRGIDGGMIYDPLELSQTRFLLLVPDDGLSLLRLGDELLNLYLFADDTVWLCLPGSEQASAVTYRSYMQQVGPLYSSGRKLKVRCLLDAYSRPIFIRIYE